MKKTRKILLAVMLAFLFAVPSYAVNIDEYYKDGLESSGAKELSEYLEDETKEYLAKLGIDEPGIENILDLSLSSVFETIYEIINNGFKAPLKGFMTASGTVLLVSVCSAFISDDEKNRGILNLLCGCVLVTGTFLSAKDAISSAATVLECCVTFEKALIPVLAGVVSAGGNPTVALTYKGAAFAAAEFISSFSKSFALPLVGISGALGITGAMMPTLRLSAISEMIRKTMTTALASTASLFSGFIALKNIVSASADGLLNKGVKLASGAFIPIIGSTLGEIYASVTGSFGLLKNTVGIYAIISFLAVCIPVIVNLALWAISMKAACVLSDLLDCRVCSEILKNTSFVFSMINTVIVFCVAVFIVSTGLVISIRTGE